MNRLESLTGRQYRGGEKHTLQWSAKSQVRFNAYYALDLAPRPRPRAAPFLGLATSGSGSESETEEAERALAFVGGSSGSDSLAVEFSTFSSACCGKRKGVRESNNG